MGSTVMHFCLTKTVISKLKIDFCKKKIDDEIQKIYIGSVLPDISAVHKKTKEGSHYILEVDDEGLNPRIPNIDLFLKIYGKDILNNNYLLGELIHLVSDRIWYGKFIPKYAKKLSKDGKILFDFKQKKNIPDTEFREKIYNDYSDINLYLISKYKLDLPGILKYEENREISSYIVKNIKSGINGVSEKAKVSKNIFEKLNYIEETDIAKWIKESEMEILKIICELKRKYRGGNGRGMKVIVGLGNIGKEYEKTRHNVGFMAIDFLAKKYNISFIKKMKKCIIGEGSINGKKVILAKPTTFMNLSSAAIVEIKNWYKVENVDVLVIYDDVDINIGDIRFREEGSGGTHNGMKDILANLKTNQLSRIRIGIENRKGLPIELGDYVLSNFTKDEIKILETDIFAEIDEKVTEFLDK